MFGESEAEVGWLVVQEKRGKGCSLPSCGLQMHLLFCPPSTNFYAARIIGIKNLTVTARVGAALKTNTPKLTQLMYNKEEQGYDTQYTNCKFSQQCHVPATGYDLV